MEIIDKEQKLTIHCRNNEEFDSVCNYLGILNTNWFLHEQRTCINLPEKTINDIECNNRDYFTGVKYLERLYLKQIEEKDKEINRIQKLGEEVLEAYDYNTSKLQKAKELLKRANLRVGTITNSDESLKREIERFLK